MTMGRAISSRIVFQVLIPIGVVLSVACVGQAGVAVYTGPTSEKLYVEAAPKLGKNTFFVKFEGIESKWAKKVIKTERSTHTSGERFSFEYDLELSSGVQKRTYEMIVESGSTLKKGTVVKQVELFFPEGDLKSPLKLTYDEDLTKASQGVGLVAEHKKHPFKPEVD